jgi:hypothetical protein
MDAEDDAWDAISCVSIRIDLDKLKEWMLRHIPKEPFEHRIMMVKLCEKFLSFSEQQQARLRNPILFTEEANPRKSRKVYRKLAIAQIFNWAKMVEALREAERRWSVSEVQKISRVLQHAVEEVEHALGFDASIGGPSRSERKWNPALEGQ